MQEAFELMAALRQSVAVSEGTAAKYASAGDDLTERGFVQGAARMADAVADCCARADAARAELAALEATYGSPGATTT